MRSSQASCSAWRKLAAANQLVLKTWCKFSPARPALHAHLPTCIKPLPQRARPGAELPQAGGCFWVGCHQLQQQTQLLLADPAATAAIRKPHCPQVGQAQQPAQARCQPPGPPLQRCKVHQNAQRRCVGYLALHTSQQRCLGALVQLAGNQPGSRRRRPARRGPPGNERTGGGGGIRQEAGSARMPCTQQG